MTCQVESKRARRVVRFVEEFLVVLEGKDVGKPVKLRDWQLEFIDKVYGTPTRRSILSMGRKNGKSAITAMLLLAHLVGPTAWSASAAPPAAPPVRIPEACPRGEQGVPKAPPPYSGTDVCHAGGTTCGG